MLSNFWRTSLFIFCKFYHDGRVGVVISSVKVTDSENNIFNPNWPSVVFRGVICDLIWAVNKVTGFYMNFNTGLK